MATTTARDISRPGLRERKKHRTRELISQTARSLFVERGFDRVPVAEVARAAEVSEQTVFNYFPTKEDLVYWRLERFEDELIRAIRERADGESIPQAFGRFVLRRRGLLAEADPEKRQRLVDVTRMIAESPTLLTREREIYDRYANSLAAVIAEEAGVRDEIEAWVIASSLLGVHRALVDHTRRRILEGAPSEQVSRELRTRGRRALGALERGLRSLGVG